MISVQPVSNSVNEEVRDGWAELLSRYPWDWFLTLTYANRSGVGVESATRNFKSFLYRRLLHEALRVGLASRPDSCEPPRATGPWPNAYRAKKRWSRSVWVIGLEAHRDGVLHLHGILRLPPVLAQASRREAHQDWFLRYGINRIEPPKSRDDVARYVSKYIVKDGEVILSESFDAPTMRVG